MFGPFGVGILQVSEKYLGDMIPFNFGGGIIKDVQIEKTIFRDFPHNLDAGTPNVSGVIGLAAALKLISDIGKSDMESHLNNLTLFALDQLPQVPGIEIIGNPKKRIGIISFNLNGVHFNDLAMLLDKKNIAIRTGHHCAQPIMERFNIPGTVRASFAVYNTEAEIDTFIEGIKKVKKLFG